LRLLSIDSWGDHVESQKGEEEEEEEEEERRRRGQPRHTGIEPGVEKEIKNKVCQQNRTMTLLMLIYIFTRSNARVLC
jgi:hypothetical protein